MRPHRKIEPDQAKAIVAAARETIKTSKLLMEKTEALIREIKKTTEIKKRKP